MLRTDQDSPVEGNPAGIRRVRFLPPYRGSWKAARTRRVAQSFAIGATLMSSFLAPAVSKRT